ncbi:MAG: four helix bundle protein [Bacteroidales bacterium]|nr:four helix bundle protein [Bacteroidales bacterium]
MDLEELEIYEISMNLGEKAWGCVSSWKYFEKDTLGKQLVRSADSIAANISEGFGRYHYADAKHFFYFARGSLFETKTWLKKAHSRQLIEESDYLTLQEQINRLGVKLNNFIKTTGKKGV